MTGYDWHITDGSKHVGMRGDCQEPECVALVKCMTSYRMTVQEIEIANAIRDALWDLESGHPARAERKLNELVEELENPQKER